MPHSTPGRPTKREKALSKVRKLMALAAHPATPSMEVRLAEERASHLQLLHRLTPEECQAQPKVNPASMFKELIRRAEAYEQVKRQQEAERVAAEQQARNASANDLRGQNRCRRPGGIETTAGGRTDQPRGRSGVGGTGDGDGLAAPHGAGGGEPSAKRTTEMNRGQYDESSQALVLATRGMLEAVHGLSADEKEAAETAARAFRGKPWLGTVRFGAARSGDISQGRLTRVHDGDRRRGIAVVVVYAERCSCREHFHGNM